MNPEPPVLKVRKIDASAFLPRRATRDSVGYDLFASRLAIIPKGEQRTVFLHIAIQVPCGTYGRIASRSGLAAKSNIHVGAGVIDPGYSGDVGVLLMNFGREDLVIRRGDAIAQLILERCEIADVKEVHYFAPTERGIRGFGSTSLPGSSIAGHPHCPLGTPCFSPDVVVDELHPHHQNSLRMESRDVAESSDTVN